MPDVDNFQISSKVFRSTETDGIHIPHVIIEQGAQAITPTWVLPANVTITADTPIDVLAAGAAQKTLMIINISASQTVYVAWDGANASATHGIPLAAGKGLVFSYGEVPISKITAFSVSAAGTLFVAYA